ncbi:MAG: BamA/TamA family outer membrane protein, partial [Flavisolibacter sp.]|nr:BamA/TamA family outer membrane protein [Flavisolibacter sp.]
IAPALPLSVAVDTMGPLPNDTLLAANPKLEGNFIRNLFMGKNYRQEWVQQIRVPVLDLGTEMGGLTPTRKGGGKQTKSLRLDNKDGKEWILRSIEKFPEAAMPADLRRTVARDLVEQGVSASYPYASLSVGPIAKAAGVPYIRRKLLYIPDDPRLTRFRSDFANTMAILEEREPANVKKTQNTDDLALLLAKDNDDHVDQKAVLKARLMDNFIMDFDRHEDQWRWATYDTGKGKMYYAIPRDHDQAFFVNQGILPYLASKPWLLPSIQGFRPRARNINTFNYAARNFDRFFLNGLSKEDWRRQVDTFLTQMTDDVLATSLSRQPKEIQQYHSQFVINTLKKRREYFMSDMMKYYDFLSKKVDVVGTNQREQFTITKNDDGSVQVVENKIDKSENISSKIYDRTFDPAVTQEIHIYGLGDNDRYIIRGGHSPVKIRIIGGPGNDEFINEGTGGNVLVYDASFEQNKISGNPGLHNRISKDPQVNRYNRLGYKYDIFAPSLSIAYNIDDGLYLGGRIEVTRQGFRKEPFSRRHLFVANHALRTSSYRFRYDADFTKAVGNQDLLLRADIRAPVNVANFFGIGNNTTIRDGITNKREFYRARYDFIDFSVLLRRQLQSWMRIHYGPTFQYFNLKPEQNRGKFVSFTHVNGLDSSRIYKDHSYAGAFLRLDIDSRFNKVIPNRGLILDASVKPLIGLGKSSRSLVQANLDMRIFMSLAAKQRFVLATRLGAGRNYGHYEFQQAQYLSGTENLRGYRR